ncbi:MAG: hypothetical protein K2P81_01780 [Bacteriovoracaceae bacterium]|nr:hypothetical protein [Bacteriovoracaceae bacterium]
MKEKLLAVGLEMAVLCGIALLYYFWQRHRILKGPRGWQISKLDELHHMGVTCSEPEKYSDLDAFLTATEEKLNSESPWIEGEYLRRWKNASLPEEMRATLADCEEWFIQSQPKTR